MREVVEFRLDEHDARGLIPAGIGRTLGESVRVVTLETTDELYDRLRVEAARRARAGEPLFTSWQIRRTYDPSELAAAELLQLLPIGGFEPEGEECGTRYDESTACPRCGVGRRQLTPLAIDPRRVQPERDIETQTFPLHKDVNRSIADEIVISERLATLLDEAGATGVELGPVVRCRTAKPLPGLRQLIVTGSPVEAVPPTTYGKNPFDLDEAGECRCPAGHVAGLNLLSELTIDRSTWSGEDVVPTRQWIGQRVGVLVPTPSILVSGRLYRLMAEARIRGARFEVVHLA